MYIDKSKYVKIWVTHCMWSAVRRNGDHHGKQYCVELRTQLSVTLNSKQQVVKFVKPRSKADELSSIHCFSTLSIIKNTIPSAHCEHYTEAVKYRGAR